jgi:hypothetical protein
VVTPSLHACKTMAFKVSCASTVVHAEDVGSGLTRRIQVRIRGPIEEAMCPRTGIMRARMGPPYHSEFDDTNLSIISLCLVDRFAHFAPLMVSIVWNLAAASTLAHQYSWRARGPSMKGS